jgi:hypothetical protein
MFIEGASHHNLLNDFSVPDMNASTYEGKSVILIGWGSKNLLGPVSNTLKKIDISVLPQRFVQ